MLHRFGILLAIGAIAVLPLTEQVQHCPSSEFEIWGKNCYTFTGYESLNWQSARSRCQTKGLGSDLTSILSAEENDYIYNKMKPLTYDVYWIGMRKDQGDKDNLKSMYYWVDGSTKTYENWAPGEPNDHSGVEDCVEVYYSGSIARQWNDITCSKYARGYVCKAPLTENWVKYNGYEYFISARTGEVSSNWFDANAWCMENGGYLASVLSQEEATQIGEWATSMLYTGGLWIGLNKLDGDRSLWKWVDGSSMNGFTNWHMDYPKNNNWGHYCAYQMADDKEGKWRNNHCDDRDKGFICKRKEGTSGSITTPSTAIVEGFCPSGYFEVGNKCFRAREHDIHNGKTWEEALDICRRGPGFQPDLASVADERETAYITAHLQNLTYGFWIGLRRSSYSGSNERWRWSDSSPTEYENWGPSEPSGSTDNCAEIWVIPGPVGTWNNLKCEEKRGYLCQTFKSTSAVISTPPLTTAHNCGSDWIPYGYGCYKYHDLPSTWDDASVTCQAEGGFLVSIHSGAENAAIQTVVITTQQDVWIGLHDKQGKGEYSWSDGWLVIYTKWGEMQPSRPEGGGCVIMHEDGSWEDTVCDTKNPFICKKTDAGHLTTPKEVEGLCPSRITWIGHGSYCYHFSDYFTATWHEAHDKCAEMSPLSSLASIHSLAENEWVYKMLTTLGNPSGNIWLGMYRQKQSLAFAWTDFTPVVYENWAPGEPNGEMNGEDCVEMYVNSFPKMWNDHDCNQYRSYVCKALKVPPLPTFTPVPGYCPGAGWEKFGQHCYLFMPDVHLTWNTARGRCVQEGGLTSDLAILDTEVEDVYVSGMMFERTKVPKHTNFWIGLSKKRAEEPYLWVNGQSVGDYSNWADGQPSDKNGNWENCGGVYFEDGKWFDEDCNTFYGFVCKVEIAPATQSIDDSSDGLDGGQVAGIVIGVLLGAILIGGIVVFLLTRQNVISNPIDKVKTGFSNPFYGAQKSRPDDTEPTISDA